MALLEAAASSLPAVVTDVGGNRDLVLDGETGYVVPPANSEALANAMTRLMELPDPEREKLGAFARRYCVENYRFQKIGDEWVRLYRDFMVRNALRPSQRAITDDYALKEK
jgi:glycosyltransferase involved in cell wall biosynthesis